MIVMDLATRHGKLWFQHDFFQVCDGLQLVRFQNHDKTSLGTIANFSNGCFKARHSEIVNCASGSQLIRLMDRSLFRSSDSFREHCYPWLFGEPCKPIRKKI